MDTIQKLVELVSSHSALILGVLFSVSELLSLIPAVKSNGIFQMVFSFLQKKKVEQSTAQK